MRLLRWLLVPIAATTLQVGVFTFPNHAYAVILLSCLMLHPLLLALERNRRERRRIQ